MLKRLPYYLIFSLAVCCIVSAPALSQNPSPSQVGRDKSEKPSKYSAALQKGEFQDTQIESAQDQARRQLRESRYKDTYSEIKDPADSNPTGPTKETTVVISDYAEQIEPLPVARSAAVVVGTVLSGKAFVSKDRTYVYSDYQVRVDEVLKQDPTANLVVGGQIIASRGGGTIHFPSGRIKDFINAHEGMPAIGSQYLFFLVKPNIPEPEYEVIIGGAYELEDGKVHPLDDFNMEFDSTSEPELLSKVRTNFLLRCGHRGPDHQCCDSAVQTHVSDRVPLWPANRGSYCSEGRKSRLQAEANPHPRGSRLPNTKGNNSEE